MSVQPNCAPILDDDFVDPNKKSLLSAEQRAMITWAAGSLVLMSYVYASMPERNDNSPDYNKKDGVIVLGYN